MFNACIYLLLYYISMKYSCTYTQYLGAHINYRLLKELSAIFVIHIHAVHISRLFHEKYHKWSFCYS